MPIRGVLGKISRCEKDLRAKSAHPGEIESIKETPNKSRFSGNVKCVSL